MSRMEANDYMGVLPDAGTTMYILYHTGGGEMSNIGANTLTTITHLNMNISGNCDDPNNSKKIISVRNTLQVTNPTPSYGGKDVPSNEEIKYLVKYNSSAQERCITLKDYYSRIGKIHPKYGVPYRYSVVEENNKGNGEWITYDSSKLWSQEKDVARNYIKKEIQRWRNMLPKRVEKDKGIIKGVDDFYLGFPTIRNFILNYYTMVQKKKKNRCKVKQLQCDCIMIETKVMSHKVCKRLEEYGVYAITLHDGVYIRECDKELLHSINVSVENIFWEELNRLIDQPSLQQVV
jgi:hypothetical protein